MLYIYVHGCVEEELTSDDERSDENSSVEDHADEEKELVNTFTTMEANLNKLQINVLQEEKITSPPKIKQTSKPTNDPVNDTDDEIFIAGMDFSSMQKRDDVTPKPSAHVVYNDLDLKDLQKTFLRRGKLKHLKVKSNEHMSDGNSSSSECSSENNSDDDDVINIPQGANGE